MGRSGDETAGVVFHAAQNARRAQGVLNGIELKYLNPESRFGRAFYAAEDAATAVAEVTHHGSDVTHNIRFSVNPDAARVLDLTDPAVARRWGYEGGPITPATQSIGSEARSQGYNTIRFPSERGRGANIAVLDDFSEVLQPQAVAPVAE